MGCTTHAHKRIYWPRRGDGGDRDPLSLGDLPAAADRCFQLMPVRAMSSTSAIERI